MVFPMVNIPNYDNWLLVEKPSWKMMDFVNGFRMTSHIWWKIKVLFQTTNYDKLWTVGWWHLNFRKIWKEICWLWIWHPVTSHSGVFRNGISGHRIARSWHGFGDGCRATGCTVRRAVGAVGSVLSVPQVSRSWPHLPPITIWFMDVYWYICNNIELLCFLITNKPKKGHHPPFFFWWLSYKMASPYVRELGWAACQVVMPKISHGKMSCKGLSHGL